MSAKTKSELLAAMQAEFQKLTRALEDLEASHGASVADLADEGGITLKQMLATRSRWINLFLGWHRDGKAGRPVQTPAPGYRWTDLKKLNARFRDEARDLQWATVREEFEAAHSRMTALVEGLGQDALYAQRLYDWMDDWPLGRWAEASGPSQYRSARKSIERLARPAARAA